MKGSARARKPHALVVLAALALAACTSTPDVLEPSALLGSDASDPNQQPPEFPLASTAAPATTTPGSGAVAAIATSARVRFAPVVGAPGTASSPLATRLTQSAGQRGIGLVGADDPSATHVMKGYFSAISEGGETTVIYVWDVLDPTGTRVHRIQGQAKSASGRIEGWDGVQPATMEAIADQTVEQLALWLSARQG